MKIKVGRNYVKTVVVREFYLNIPMAVSWSISHANFQSNHHSAPLIKFHITTAELKIFLKL